MRATTNNSILNISWGHFLENLKKVDLFSKEVLQIDVNVLKHPFVNDLRYSLKKIKMKIEHILFVVDDLFELRVRNNYT